MEWIWSLTVMKSSCAFIKDKIPPLGLNYDAARRSTLCLCPCASMCGTLLGLRDRLLMEVPVRVRTDYTDEILGSTPSMVYGPRNSPIGPTSQHILWRECIPGTFSECKSL